MGEGVTQEEPVQPLLIVESYALVAGETLEGDALERFAKADGFDGWSDMSRWFELTHGLPFHGLAIYWGQSRENNGRGAGQ